MVRKYINNIIQSNKRDLFFLTASLRGNIVDCLEARSTSVCHYALLMDDPHTTCPYRNRLLSNTDRDTQTHSLSLGQLSTADSSGNVV